MSADIIVEKYANSLFEVAVANKSTVSVAAEMECLSKIFSEKTTLEFFKSPFNSPDNKGAAAKSALEGKVSTEVFNFVATLIQNQRLHLIENINNVFKIKVSRMGGEAEGILFVATEPTAEFKALLENKITGILKKQVRLNIQQDKTLISGFKVQVEGWTFNDSAAHHLNKITEDISKRGL